MLRPVTIDGLTLRELPVDEWPRLSDIPGPLMGHTLGPTTAAESTRILVAEDPLGTIVLYWVASAQVHLDPIYIAPEHRHRAHLLLGAIGAMLRVLEELGVSTAFAFVMDADQPENGQIMEKLNLRPIPAQVYGGTLLAPSQVDQTLAPRPWQGPVAPPAASGGV